MPKGVGYFGRGRDIDKVVGKATGKKKPPAKKKPGTKVASARRKPTTTKKPPANKKSTAKTKYRLDPKTKRYVPVK